MAFTKIKWKKRIQHRSDMSTYVTHLTKNGKSSSLVENLIKILKDKTILGSSTDTGFIIGNTKAVCFQDAPIYGITQNIIHEQENRQELGGKVRYLGCGIIFDKTYVYRKGGRPVIYEDKSTAKKILPPEDWWRIVSFDLSNDENIIDWTHEREWRVPGNFTFELEEAYICLPNPTTYKQFLKTAEQTLLDTIKGIIVLGPIIH